MSISINDEFFIEENWIDNIANGKCMYKSCLPNIWSLPCPRQTTTLMSNGFLKWLFHGGFSSYTISAASNRRNKRIKVKFAKLENVHSEGT